MQYGHFWTPLPVIFHRMCGDGKVFFPVEDRLARNQPQTGTPRCGAQRDGHLAPEAPPPCGYFQRSLAAGLPSPPWRRRPPPPPSPWSSTAPSRPPSSPRPTCTACCTGSSSPPARVFIVRLRTVQELYPQTSRKLPSFLIPFFLFPLI